MLKFKSQEELVNYISLHGTKDIDWDYMINKNLLNMTIITIYRYEIGMVNIYKYILDNKLPRFPYKTWISVDAEDVSKELIKYLLEERLEYSKSDIMNNVSFSFFVNYKLRTMVDMLYNGSAYDALNTAYPDVFKEWELQSTTNRFWNLETAKEATKWLVEGILKIDTNSTYIPIDFDDFKNNNLTGLVNFRKFKGSVEDVIKNAYGNDKKVI